MIAAVRGTTKGFTTSIGRGRSGTDVVSVRLLRDRGDDENGAGERMTTGVTRSPLDSAKRGMARSPVRMVTAE